MVEQFSRIQFCEDPNTARVSVVIVVYVVKFFYSCPILWVYYTEAIASNYTIAVQMTPTSNCTDLENTSA